MRIRKFGPLYQLTFMPRFFPVNCYLYEDKKELILIDAALSFSYKGIVEASKEVGKPITKILLTHAHGDHVGALDKIKETFPDAKVYISKRDAKLMNRDVSLEPHEPQTPIKGGVPKNLETKPDILLNEGDQVGPLKAINAPGHTPGLMAFYNEEKGILIAGDAIQTRGGIAVAGHLKPLFPFPAFGTWDKKTSIESAKKLIGYNPKILAVGHGNVLENPEQAMKKAVVEAEESLER